MKKLLDDNKTVPRVHLPVEITNHKFICPHARMKKHEEIIMALQKKTAVPKAISNAVCDIIENYFLGTD